MRTLTKVFVPILIIMAIAWLVYEAKRADKETKPEMRDLATAAARRECPHAYPYFRKDNAGLDPIQFTKDIPEFNDCQRFIVDTGGRATYDSLYAIFAVAELDQLPTRLAQLDPTMRGEAAVLAAIIYTEGGVYPKLGLKETFSCLYLFRDPAWQAIMLPESEARQGACRPDESSDVLARRGTQLAVLADSLNGEFADSFFPPVARWDWDQEHRQQYLGVKCGAAWCEVGPPGFSPSPRYAPAPGATPEERAVIMIKGWYDEQLLATLPSGASSVEPTGNRGTVFPVPGLGSYMETGVFAARWVQVAEMALAQASQPYKDKFNFDQAAPGGTLNRESLCYGTRRECLGLLPWILKRGPFCGPDEQWFSRLDAVDGSSRYKCVRRYPGPEQPRIPGTARWRWLATDETSWKRCLPGCCETQ